MNRQEDEIFRGIFNRLGYFEIPEIDYSEDEKKEVLDSYSSVSLPKALHDLTSKMIRHIEAISDADDGCKERMLS